MDLTLEYRLKVRLHFTPGNLYPNSQRQCRALFYFVDIFADYDNLAVVYVFGLNACNKLKRCGLVSAKLHMRRFFSARPLFACR